MHVSKNRWQLPGPLQVCHTAPVIFVAADETSLSNTFVCQPQQRNMQGRIFGGFLMRRAFELAFATTYLFAGSRPSFVRVDEVTFK